jgi:uridine kinase
MSDRQSNHKKEIKPAPLRQIVQVRLPDGRAFDGPSGATIEDFIEVAQPEVSGRIVAAVVNNKLRELSKQLTTDVDLVPVSTADSDGVRIYRRSLSFLLIAAAEELFPDRAITIEHSMPFGGYYCEVIDAEPLSDEELDCLRQHMRELVEADLPINQLKVPLDEALQLFHENNDQEKADLFTRRRKDYLTLYELNDVRDYFHGFMVPSTGYLDLFDLRQYHEGFILQFPRRHQPDRLQPFEDEPRLAQVFQEYNKWLEIVGVPNVSALNWAINDGRTQEVILVAEALHERQLASIAGEIAEHRQPIKIILISGPTSAGKTTLSKRLAVQLMAQGIHPVAVNLDNYFVNREDTPLDETGDYDFVALQAPHLPLFQLLLRHFLDGETSAPPLLLRGPPPPRAQNPTRRTYPSSRISTSSSPGSSASVITYSLGSSVNSGSSLSTCRIETPWSATIPATSATIPASSAAATSIVSTVRSRTGARSIRLGTDEMLVKMRFSSGSARIASVVESTTRRSTSSSRAIPV